MNKIELYEQEQIKRLTQEKTIPDFIPGDTVRVLVTVQEKDKTRKQAYEGVCIARRNRALRSSFTVRKIAAHGEGVERLFFLYSPNIAINVVRRGVVRRAKLYYLRSRRGKSARIAEKHRSHHQRSTEKKQAPPSTAQNL